MVGQIADPTPEGNFVNNELDEAGIARIAGLDQLVTSDLLAMTQYGADGSGDMKLAFTAGNILLGGGGSDLIEGRGGNDVIDGDAWLNVRISIAENADGTGAEIASVDGMNGNVTLNGETKPLSVWMLSGAINPGQLNIVREILHDSSGTDTAAYWADRAAYDIAVDDVTGRITVAHVNVDGAATDPVTGKNRVSNGTDKLTNIEVIAFDDMNVNVVMGTEGNDWNAANVLQGTAGNDIIIGLAGDDRILAGDGDDALYGGIGNDRLVGGAGNDYLDGGAGDDTLLAGGGNDTLVWNGGRDLMNGQGGTDTALILGSANEAESFIVYDRTNALAQGFLLAANTEIAIIRNGTLIAELDNIEEIVIDGRGGGDSFTINGDFTGTSLAMSTITVLGSEDDDTVDMSALSSAHRVVFKSNGGTDTVIGPMREQDSVEDVGDGQVNFINTGPAPETPTDGGGSGGDDDQTGGEGPDDDVAGDREVLLGTDTAEALIGGSARDMIFGGGGNDIVMAGAGADMVFGDGGNDRIFAEAGNDYVNAGAGNDVVFGGSGNDTFVAEAGDGDDTYYGDEMEGGSGIDTLDMSAITANITADLGSGFMGRGSVSSAQTGNDTIWGVENIVTGSGNDDIRANASVNVIDGGAGNDIFRFGSAADADGDVIMGFQPGDRIDLSEIDADGGSGGDQSFTLVSDGFSGRGQLMVSHEDREDGAYTVVEGNTSGGDHADFSISIKGTHHLNESHFSL